MSGTVNYVNIYCLLKVFELSCVFQRYIVVKNKETKVRHKQHDLILNLWIWISQVNPQPAYLDPIFYLIFGQSPTPLLFPLPRLLASGM